MLKKLLGFFKRTAPAQEPPPPPKYLYYRAFFVESRRFMSWTDLDEIRHKHIPPEHPINASSHGDIVFAIKTYVHSLWKIGVEIPKIEVSAYFGGGGERTLHVYSPEELAGMAAEHEMDLIKSQLVEKYRL